MSKPANLTLKCLLELAALGAFAIWGADVGSGVSAVILAVAGIPFELGVFLLAALALLAAGHAVAAPVPINALCLTAFDQWEG
jgi:hypothetical protein